MNGVRIIVIITQGLHLINRTLPTLTGASKERASIRYVDNRLALDVLYASLPILPVVLASDQKSYQHARIHLTNMDATEPRSVTRSDLLLGIVVWVLVVGECGSGMVGVEVEQERTLCPNKVV